MRARVESESGLGTWIRLGSLGRRCVRVASRLEFCRLYGGGFHCPSECQSLLTRWESIISESVKRIVFCAGERAVFDYSNFNRCKIKSVNNFDVSPPCGYQ